MGSSPSSERRRGDTKDPTFPCVGSTSKVLWGNAQNEETLLETQWSNPHIQLEEGEIRSPSKDPMIQRETTIQKEISQVDREVAKDTSKEQRCPVPNQQTSEPKIDVDVMYMDSDEEVVEHVAKLEQLLGINSSE